MTNYHVWGLDFKLEFLLSIYGNRSNAFNLMSEPSSLGAYDSDSVLESRSSWVPKLMKIQRIRQGFTNVSYVYSIKFGKNARLGRSRYRNI